MVRRRAPCFEVDGINKGSWTPEEDMKLVAYVQKHGHDNWRALPKLAGLKRCGKSCRLRWINYLRPDVKRGNFTEEEEMTIIRLHASLGNKWSRIATHLPGRTDNEIKNVWHTHLKKRVEGRNPNMLSRKRKSKRAASSSSSNSCADGDAGRSSSTTTTTSTANLSDLEVQQNCPSPNQDSDGNAAHDSNGENVHLWEDHMTDRGAKGKHCSITGESRRNSSSSEANAVLRAEVDDASWSARQCGDDDAYINEILQDLIEIPCESLDPEEIWRLMDDDRCVLAPDQVVQVAPMAEDGGVPQWDDISAETYYEESKWDAEKSIWLAYLEKELDL